MNIIQTLSSPEAAGVYPAIAMPPGVRVSEASRVKGVRLVRDLIPHAFHHIRSLGK